MSQRGINLTEEQAMFMAEKARMEVKDLNLKDKKKLKRLQTMAREENAQ